MTKEEILSEIKRTAQENGGRPLGRERFERVTGIKAYHWSKYWARFSDLQIEAGFEPNRLNQAYDDGFLLDELAKLTLEIGKYPTKIEIRRKSFDSTSFPSANVYDRLGPKSNLLLRLYQYCENKPEHAEVLHILSDDVERIKDQEDTGAASGNISYGFVYLVKGHPGEYKIGRTNLVDRRLSELGATASIEQTLVHEIKTDDPAGIESYWHKRFHAKRMRGEWFKLDSDDVRAFKRWKRIF